MFLWFFDRGLPTSERISDKGGEGVQKKVLPMNCGLGFNTMKKKSTKFIMKIPSKAQKKFPKPLISGET